MEQKWPLVYLKSLMFNPCTSRILWRGKKDSSPKCWQLHPSMLRLPALDMLPRSWCPLSLVSLGPGVCPTMLLSVSSPWFPYSPPWDFLHLLVLPPSMASSQPAASWPSQGKAPT